jgi:hypothetical protein
LARLQAARAGAEATQPERAGRLFKQAQERSAERMPWGSLLALGLLLAGLGLSWFGRRALGAGTIAWQEGRWGLVLFGLGSALWAFSAYHG